MILRSGIDHDPISSYVIASGEAVDNNVTTCAFVSGNGIMA